MLLFVTGWQHITIMHTVTQAFAQGFTFDPLPPSTSQTVFTSQPKSRFSSLQYIFQNCCFLSLSELLAQSRFAILIVVTGNPS